LTTTTSVLPVIKSLSELLLAFCMVSKTKGIY